MLHEEEEGGTEGKRGSEEEGDVGDNVEGGEEEGRDEIYDEGEVAHPPTGKIAHPPGGEWQEHSNHKGGWWQKQGNYRQEKSGGSQERKGRQETVVGYSQWLRRGSSVAAQKWQEDGLWKRTFALPRHYASASASCRHYN